MTESRVGPIVVLVLSVVVALFTILPAIFLVMSTAGCRDGCSLALVEVGIWIALVGPWVALVIGTLFTIVRLVRRQRALKAALFTLGATVIAFIAGVAWTFIAIG
jgi:hypothetical protein